MLPIYFYITITYLFVHTEALRINSVSAKNVAKRESGSDLFPKDFLPFKKQSEEFEELKQKSKVKPKKRLAPPVNFMLRAAEAESDDYYDKGQGEGEEDYEKKEWSDANRPLEPIDKNEADNHTVVSDIDGVVSILVGKPYPLSDITESKPEVVEVPNTTKSEDSSEQNKTEENSEPTKETKQQSTTINTKKYEDESDYDDDVNEKKKLTPIPEDEQNANEAKKAGILNSVDDLKERHAQEQRAINEKLKEEEMYIEQQERDKINSDRFSTEHNKYDDGGTQKTSKHLPDYEDYPEESTYTVTPKRIKSTTRAQNKRTNKKKAITGKKLETGRISVFKNPQLFMVYDDEVESTTKNAKQKKNKSNKFKNNKLKQKYSSTYNSTPKNTGNVERISLIPIDDQGRNGEPALFFPKKKKNKKNRTPRPVDSIVAETVSDTAKKLTTAIVPTKEDLANTETVTSDAVAAASAHASKGKDENYHREKGGGKEYSSAHEEDHHEEGKKAYEGVHEETKTAEGHHEKENHLGKYDDHGDINKLHEEESGHYGSHEHEEHGKKNAKYEESGKHSKGHSTKGSHDIHKKEEYEKKVEFFEEEGDSGEEEKNGGYHHDKGHSEGGHFKKNGLNAGHEQHSKGESGDHAGGWILHMAKGHKSAAGNDGHHKHGEDHAAKKGKHSGKKWIYHHGSPAHTANLVRIDRRTEPRFSAPYYG